jgi:O-antigen/teichoic acid export membrane protein
MTNAQIHKGSQFKKIAKHSPWYIVPNLLTKASSFFLLPIYTRYLSPTDYGILGNLQAVSLLLPILISLYLDSAFGRYYYLERAVSEERVKRLYSTHFWFVCLWGGIVTIVGLIISTFTLVPLVEVPFFPYMPLVFIPPVLSQLAIMGSQVFRANLRAREIGIVRVASFVASTSLILVLLVPCKMGVLARLYGAAIGPLINFIVFTVIAVRNSLLEFVFDATILRRSLAYALPMVPNIAGGWITRASDKLILTYYGALSDVGLYVLATQIAYILYLVNDSMTQVQGPIGMSALTDDAQKGRKQISAFLSFYVWVVLLFYLGLAFFSKEVLYFLTDEKFHLAYKVVWIVAFEYVLSGIYRIFTTIISFHGKTWVISSGAILSALGDLVMNLVLIPRFGQLGAAGSTVLSVAIYTLWIVYWAQKTSPTPIDHGIVRTSFLVALILLVVQQVLQANEWFGFWQTFGLKVLIISIYGLMVFVAPGFQRVRHRLLSYLRVEMDGRLLQ